MRRSSDLRTVGRQGEVDGAIFIASIGAATSCGPKVAVAVEAADLAGHMAQANAGA